MGDEKLLKEVESVLKHISDAVEAERSTFFLLNRKKMTLESIVAEGIKNITISVPIQNGIAGRVAREGVSFLENDVDKNPIWDNDYDKQLKFKTESIICVPVLNGKNEVIGVLQSLNKRNSIFTRKDVNTLNAFAETIALIVKNTQLFLVSEEIKNNFSTLLNVFETVSSELELDNLIQLIMTKAAEIARADRSSLFFRDEETNELWTKYAKGLDTITVRTKKGLVGLVADTKKACIVNDPYNHPSFDSSIDSKTGYKTNSILGVPVFASSGNILGVIQVINKLEGQFEESDLSILQGFAIQIRVAVENAQLFSQISNMKNYLNTLVENLDNGIVTIDKSGNIQTINNTFYRMFGLEEKSLVNKKIENLNQQLHSLLQFSDNVLKTEQKHYEYGVEYKINKTKNIICNLSVLPMHDSNSNIIGVVNVFQDVTKDKRIRLNLSRYIPQHLVNEVINSDDLSVLQSRSRKCTILFSDIRNFTKLTEELGAVQIVELLNKYFDVMVTAIHLQNGILDKFIGDAVMAVFGVPYTNSSDSFNAVKCALKMFDLLDGLNQAKNVGVNLNIGIGISTGNVISGNIGSERRFEYTVIGDPVNLAARLESETKKYNVKILICENTYRNVFNHFNCREIDSVLIRGKQKHVKIYTVDSEIGQEKRFGYSDFSEYFSFGLKAFQNDEYKKAKGFFSKADTVIPDDGPTKLFIKRCDDILNYAIRV